MKIIVGLGNPGNKYEHTRHNIGFKTVDEIARRLHIEVVKKKFDAHIAQTRIDAQEVILVKPQTYMNESGRSVSAILRNTYGNPADLIVIHDELDLPLGSVRIKSGGGHGGHNGLRSLLEYLESPDFIRIRIGIGRPAVGMDSADYVLNSFFKEERPIAAEAVIKAAEAVKTIITDGLVKAMNLYNQK
ncbi:MAG: aminoacyl-tRNA hydrolase [Nitrospirota bacterium]